MELFLSLFRDHEYMLKQPSHVKFCVLLLCFVFLLLVYFFVGFFHYPTSGIKSFGSRGKKVILIKRKEGDAISDIITFSSRVLCQQYLWEIILIAFVDFVVF